MLTFVRMHFTRCRPFDSGEGRTMTMTVTMTMTMTMTMTTVSQVLGNKRDLPGALDETGLIERMGLSAVQVVILCNKKQVVFLGK